MADERVHHPNATLYVGLAAVAAGVILLLDHAGFVNAGYIFRLWPLILVAIGIDIGVRHRTCGGSMIGAIFLVTWGLLLLAIQFHVLTWGTAWPVVLIAVGALLLWEAVRPGGLRLGLHNLHHRNDSVFGSVEKRFTDSNFRHAQISAVFGNVELDFLTADIQDGQATLDLSVVFGAVEVRVPSTWNVIMETKAVFGSCENHTRPPLPTNSPKTLVIRGDVVFSSVEVKG